ncbi:hypothetical protein BDQ12DRAFT_320911 [Crucibulum laeve]|uniref:Uncharacterized protein n=1 Tax=Crucibulum laeve TaxID=68775 RepID=A0A5C3LTQ8_9AGAR|nr:hypothetical protein BDQ12DRAFT_320911 [Crucibulum laeve]
MLEGWEKTQPADLVAKAKQFLEGRLAVKKSQALDEYAKANPDWQLAKGFCEGTFLDVKSRITKLLFVRQLLDDNRDKYLALCTGRRDLNLKVGLIFAAGEYGQLAVAEVPGGVKYRIDEYDGLEHVIY